MSSYISKYIPQNSNLLEISEKALNLLKDEEAFEMASLAATSTGLVSSAFLP